MNDTLRAVLTSGAVWSAAIMVINTALFLFVPTFPRELVVALNGLVIAILSAVGINGVQAKVQQMRATKVR